MINYSVFNTTENHSFNLHNAIKYCMEHREDGIVFDKGVYNFYPETASEDVLCVSNHDIYGIYRIAFLIKDMKNFVIDGGDSEFIFHGSIIPFAIKHSENITVKNLTIDYDETMMRDIEVLNAGNGFFDVRFIGSDKQYVSDGVLHFYDESGNDDVFHYMSIRSIGDNKSFIPQANDEFKVFNPELRFEDLGDGIFRIYNSELDVFVGMHLITRGRERIAANVAVIESKNISIEKITMYKSYAMGVIAQKTENILIDRMVVKARESDLFSLDADATHFVHCKGLVKVTNSEFSEQQDDALNIHGIFTRIVDKTEDYILIKYMHAQAKGLDIYEKGDEIAVLDAETLIPNGKYIISDVDVVNMNYTKLYIKGGTKNIEVGDDVENLTWSSDLIFENNRVINNRARGMLIAAKGKVEIKNNYFNTPGGAILFQSDGSKWFESGATSDVDISKNIFENCQYAKSDNWGFSVIEFKPRNEFREGAYYHNYISITKNCFKACNAQLLYADNIAEIVFKNNEIEECCREKIAEFNHCGKVVR